MRAWASLSLALLALLALAVATPPLVTANANAKAGGGSLFSTPPASWSTADAATQEWAQRLQADMWAAAADAADAADEAEPLMGAKAAARDGLATESLFASAPNSVGPASAKLFLNSGLINLVASVVNVALQSDFANAPLPDSEEKLAKGKLTISNTVLKYVQFKGQSVSFVAPNQLHVTLVGFEGEVDLNWRWKGPLHISMSGNAQNTFANTNLAMVVTFAADATGRPVMQLSSFTTSIGDLGVKIHGAGSLILNLLIKLFKGTLRRTVQQKVNDIAFAAINNILATTAAKYPLVMPMGSEGLLADCTLSTALMTPASGQAAFGVSGPFLVAGFAAQFASNTNSTLDPRPHASLPDSVPANRAGGAPMLAVSLSDSFVNSALWSASQNGRFDWVFDSSQVPASSVVQLTTKLIASEAPAIYARYPDLNMSLALSQMGGQPPVSVSSAGGSVWSSRSALMFRVHVPGQADPVPVVELLLDWSLAQSFELVQAGDGSVALTGSFKPLAISAVVGWTSDDAGSLAPSIANLLGGVANGVLVPALDAALAAGIPVLPAQATTGLQLRNLYMAYGDANWVFGMDVAMASAADAQLAAESVRAAVDQHAKEQLLAQQESEDESDLFA